MSKNIARAVLCFQSCSATQNLAFQLYNGARLRLAPGAACGMCYLHNCTPPVIHRDLKSANLMVDASFRVKVGDFNLSRVTAANRATGNSVSTSVNLHSPRWSAPEVLDTGDYSKASDVYSFGIVLWEILTLRLPWAEWSHWQVLHAVIELKERPEIPSEISPRFPAPISLRS